MARRLAALLTSKKGDYGTPRDFYERLDADFGPFTVDLAAHEQNYKHIRYYSPRHDSLSQDWRGETGFLNPPYGRGIALWLQKAREAAIYGRAIIVQVLPARVGTAWWRACVMSADGEGGKLLSSVYVPETRVLWLRWQGLITGVYFHDSRLDFDGADERGESAPFDTAVIVHASPNRRPPKGSTRPGSLSWGWPR